MKAKVCKCGQLDSNCKCSTVPAVQPESPCFRGYDRKWQAFRSRLFKQRVREGKSLCGICGKAFGTNSPHADHIIPVQSADDPLFFKPDNIQFLHPECHSKKTKTDVRLGLTR